MLADIKSPRGRKPNVILYLFWLYENAKQD